MLMFRCGRLYGASKANRVDTIRHNGSAMRLGLQIVDLIFHPVTFPRNEYRFGRNKSGKANSFDGADIDAVATKPGDSNPCLDRRKFRNDRRDFGVKTKPCM